MDVIREEGLTNIGLVKTFKRMFWGLLVTAITSYLSYTSGICYTIPYFLIAVFELVVVLCFSFMFKKLSASAVTTMFYGYAILNGLTLSSIFVVYDITTISSAVLATALVFGGFALYGERTETNLINFGSYFMIALLVGIIMSVINLFLRSTMVDIFLDWAMIFLFCGLTAYDIQKFKVMENSIDCEPEKLYIYFAMELYLDFINLFIRLLSVLGNRSRSRR